MYDRQLDQRLSEHFTLREACKSATALRFGLDNSPPAQIIPRLKATAVHILEPVRAHFGGRAIVPSSWYRTETVNRLAGSTNPNSQHVRGEAVDFEVPGVSNYEVAHWIEGFLTFDQLILEFYDGSDPHSGWVHVSFTAERENRREVLRYDGRRFLAGLE